jgi:hypothetical protein
MPSAVTTVAHPAIAIGGLTTHIDDLARQLGESGLQ